MSQVDTNPFKYTDSNKRYHTYNYYLLNKFGKKCAKITLDLGFTCPNIDGTKGYGGCIYCSGGSASRITSKQKSALEQYKQGVAVLRQKWDTNSFIPYLQAYTNSYTSPDNFRKILWEVADFEGAVMIDIATRADCLEDKKIAILDELSKKIPVTIELGLQTVHDETAKIINRCHTYEEFTDCFYRIRRLAPDVKIGIHIINGLPGENSEMMKKTAKSVANLHPDLLKIHLLHVIDGTQLARLFKDGKYTPMEKDAYIKIVCDQLELLPPDMVIERLTGDGLDSTLLAPLWSKKKVSVINDIDKELFNRNTYQGIYYSNKGDI
ncbi:MAG: TIGR01212 family radical SAM protein [Clostridia bacterium]|nr:TIGR01212 family radical SAM protein [Clostridia bacterium]